MAGDLPVHPNPHVEKWATHRETLEQTFRWSKSLGRAVLFGAVVPFLAYKLIVSEFIKSDDKYGRTNRKFM